MRIICIPVIIILGLAACTQPSQEERARQELAAMEDALRQKETATIEKTYGQYGEVVASIMFEIGTADTTEWPDGIIPWASLEKPEAVRDGDVIVITDQTVTVLIDYPVKRPYEFTLTSKNGFTKDQLVAEISREYKLLYAEEERTATVKTIPLEQRQMYNRNETNGKYGIWGHDLGDLVLSEIIVRKNAAGKVVLVLGIES